MSSRLQLKHGLVAERDRLSTSADSLLVSEPSTGSASRTKGNLYVLVSSATLGGRARDAAAAAAQTIEREYYYDESAGIPILLEKCFRSANRKLRGRDGNGVQPGAMSVAVAVIRGNELYVATVGAVDAYLVRAARLLVPEHTSAPGIPAAEIRVDVWRGELSVGDSILLVSRRLTEAVGTEELKNAVVTLHPQSAVEHLHHLFVASVGEGSDAVLVVEASDLAGRGDGRQRSLAPSGDAFGELAAGSQAELARAGSGGATAVAVRRRGLLSAFTGSVGDVVDRLLDLVPHARATPRGFTPQVSRREAQRRGAIAILAFLTVILVVGVGVAFFPRLTERTPQQVGDAQGAFDAAKSKTEQALGPDGTPSVAPDQAIRLLHDAYADLGRAEAGGAVTGVADLRGRITGGLNLLYNLHHAKASLLTALPAGSQPVAIEHGPPLSPDARGIYFIDQKAATVSRVDVEAASHTPKVVVKAGDGPGQGIGPPRFLAAGGLDLLIVDARGELWTWRPSDAKGGGTLRHIQVKGTQVWGGNITDIATYPANIDKYSVYVVLPPAKQILKYTQFGDGSGLQEPTSWLTTTNEDVGAFLDMTIDFSMYTIVAANASCPSACVGDSVVKHQSGNKVSFSMAAPPDDGDLRPGHDYRYIVSAGDQTSGRIYLYDAKHQRVVVFDKTGMYLEQWMTAPPGPQMIDVGGMLLMAPADPTSGDPSTLYWITPRGLLASPLLSVEASAGPSPSLNPSASASPSPSASKPARTPRPSR